MAQLPPCPDLPSAIHATLQDDNPWRREECLLGLPVLRRWAFQLVLYGVKHGLTPVTVLRGPRQVGKTTLLNQVIEALLDEGVAAKRIFRVQFDELPTLRAIPNLDVAHFPARSQEPEVDFVLTIGERRIPLEVKY